jgi:acyl-CoA thioester hydrolase
MSREEFRYKSEFRVRFGETDLQGVVFNANYLLYIDTAQMDYLRHIGVTYALMREHGHDIFIVDTKIQFRSPAQFDEVIEAFARISKFGNSSLQMDFELYEKENERLLATSKTTYVIVDADSGTPLRVPAYLRSVARKFEENPDLEAN